MCPNSPACRVEVNGSLKKQFRSDGRDEIDQFAKEGRIDL
jgi:hypothetical protein